MLQSFLRRAEEAHATEIEGEEAAEAGFTLIELMVVLLIMAILLAIAIPTFLGVTNTAGDRSAQSNLTNALTEAKALYQQNQTYSGVTTSNFQSQAPEFTWTTGACSSSTSGNCVSEYVFSVASSGDGQGVSLAVYSSKTSTCWYAFDLEASPVSTVTTALAFPSAGVWYGKQTGQSTCTALNPNGSSSLGTFPSTGNTGQSYSTAASLT